MRTAVISVSDGAKILQDLKTPQSNPGAVSSALPQSGGLCTFGQGMEKARSLFKVNGIRGISQVLIILLAAKSDDDVSKSANELHKAGVLVYTVSSMKNVNETTAISMTSDPVSEFFVSSPGIPTVDTTKQALVDKLERGLFKKRVFPTQVLYQSFDHLNSSLAR